MLKVSQMDSFASPLIAAWAADEEGFAVALLPRLMNALGARASIEYGS